MKKRTLKIELVPKLMTTTLRTQPNLVGNWIGWKNILGLSLETPKSLCTLNYKFGFYRENE